MAAVQVQQGDELIITTERGQVVRISVDEIRIVGRASKGVKIMELRKGDRITGVVRLIEIEGQKKPENPEAEPSAETEQTSAPETSAGKSSPEESGDHSTPAEEGTSPEPEQES